MSYIWECGFQIEQGLYFRLISTMMASLKSLWLIVLDQALVDFICFSAFFHVFDSHFLTFPIKCNEFIDLA